MFHDCPTVWGCDVTNFNNFKAAGLGDFDEAVHTCNGLEDCATPALSNDPASNVVAALTPSFIERDVAAMLEIMAFTIQQMCEVLAW